MNPIPLYDLLTDKDGNPLPQEPRARYVRVGFKERPGPGRPAVVLDKETQEPLAYPVVDSYSGFVRAVDGRPGCYQMAILDDNYHVFNKELVGYLTISPPRNAAPEVIAGLDPVVLRALALAENAVNRAMDLAQSTVEHHAGTVSANAEVIRANADATRSTLALAPRNGVAVASADDDEDELREPTAIESVAMQCLSAVDVWWETRNARKQAEAEVVVKRSQGPKAAPATPPAAAPPPAPVPADPPSNAAQPPAPPAAPESRPTAPAPAAESKVVLTPEQNAQMMAVLSRLTKREQLAAQGMVMRLSEAERAAWLAEFSALTVDQAVERVREHLPAKVKGGAS